MYSETTWVNGSSPTLCTSNFNNMESQYASAITIGSIVIFPASSAPTDYLICDGSELNKESYTALYSVISSKFGGTADTFFLPDLRGKFIVGLGLGEYSVIGDTLGSSDVTLVTENLPAHTHGITYGAQTGPGSGIILAGHGYGGMVVYTNENTNCGDAHENRPEFVALSYMIRYQ